MRRTKTLTLTACVLSTLTMLGLNALARPQAAAQQPAAPQEAPHMPPGRESVEDRMQRMSKELNLSEEQKEKIRPLMEERVKQLREMREDKNLTPEQRREKARAIMKETHEKIAAVLNPEQREKLKQHMEEMREHHAGQHKEPPTNQ